MRRVEFWSFVGRPAARGLERARENELAAAAKPFGRAHMTAERRLLSADPAGGAFLHQTVLTAPRPPSWAARPILAAIDAGPGDPASVILPLFEANLASGVWVAGMKMPSERELEQQLGVPRARLGRYLAVLVKQGKIVRRVGSGTYIAGELPIDGVPHQPGGRASGSFADLKLNSLIQTACPSDVLELRLMLEPAGVQLAATRATASELAYIKECSTISSSVVGPKAFDHWDARLHLEIMMAAKNELLITLYNGISKARAQPAWRSLRQRRMPDLYRSHRAYHRDLTNALIDRDGIRCHDISFEHLTELRRRLFED